MGRRRASTSQLEVKHVRALETLARLFDHTVLASCQIGALLFIILFHQVFK